MKNIKDCDNKNYLVLNGLIENIARNYDKTFIISIYSKTENFYPNSLRIKEGRGSAIFGISEADIHEYKKRIYISELDLKKLINHFGEIYIKDSFYISRLDMKKNIEWNITLEVPSFELIEKDIYTNKYTEEECLIVGSSTHYCTLQEYIETLKTMNVLYKKFEVDRCDRDD